MRFTSVFCFLFIKIKLVHSLFKYAHNIGEVMNMKIGDVKLKDLGKVTSESLKEMGEDILDKTEEKVREMREKMDNDKTK